MERAGPHRRPMCRGIVLPDATAVFIVCDIQRPKQLIFNVPMVANHLDKRICRLPQTGNRKPVGYCWPTYLKVLKELFLGEVYSTFLPSKKACWAHQFWYLGVGQQYPVGY